MWIMARTDSLMISYEEALGTSDGFMLPRFGTEVSLGHLGHTLERVSLPPVFLSMIFQQVHNIQEDDLLIDGALLTITLLAKSTLSISLHLYLSLI